MQKENIEAVLKEYDCPYMGTDLVSGGTVKDIQKHLQEKDSANMKLT